MKKILCLVILNLMYCSFPLFASEGCARFRDHRKAELPVIKNTNHHRQLPTDLNAHILKWKLELPFLQNQTSYRSWVTCIRKYIFVDSDNDGIFDWTAIVDGKPSQKLFPLDPDIDGDGIQNLYDENPYKKDSLNLVKLIPKHLEMKKSNILLQRKVKSDFGILIVDHSDTHHLEVMKLINKTFQITSISNILKKSKQIKIIYAMRGRNPDAKIAAYHPSAQAISLPGVHRYDHALSVKEQCQLMAALIHEIGHAYLFEHITVEELTSIASTYGQWKIPRFSRITLMDKVFQQKLFNKKSQENCVSDYAEENIHEWFAENFAAYIWQKHFLNKQVCPYFIVKQKPSLSSWFEKSMSNLVPKSFNY